jgi:hypothetical protein
VAEEVVGLVDEVQRTPLREVPQTRDAQGYELTLRSGGQVRRISFSDATATAPLHRLRVLIDEYGTPLQ